MPYSTFSSSRRLIPVCLVLALLSLAGALTAAEPRTLAAFEPLLSWKLADGEALPVTVDGREIRFAPQSFFVSGKNVTFINRFDPLLAVYPVGEKSAGKFIPLSHPADKKFDARFFTDVCVSGDRIFALEQSTATIRRVTPSGTIDAMWFLTDTEGTVITRLWRIGTDAFWVYDQGARKLLLRKCDAPPDPNKSAPGADYRLNASSLAAGGSRLVAADREGETNWALLGRKAAAPDAPPTVIATITADIFQVLDVDRTGCAFAYLVDKAGPAILRAPRNGPAERFALTAPLVFPPDCGRAAQALDDGRLLLLTRPTPEEIVFGELCFPR